VPSLTAGTNVPALYPGENADVGPQRILRLNPSPTYFDILFDSEVSFSDNANFAQKPDTISSAIFVNTVQAEFSPPAVGFGPGNIATAIGVVGQWYNYDDHRLESLDFNAQTLFIDAKYNLNQWQIFGGVNLTRLVNQGNYDETYREFLPSLGAQRMFQLNDRLFLTVGDLVDYHLTRVPSLGGSLTDINDRFDNIASVSLIWPATKHLIFQPYYRFQYSNYRHNTLATSDRNDYLQSFGLQAIYYFNQNINLRAFFGYNRKQSDDPFTPDYREINGGLGVSLDIRF